MCNWIDCDVLLWCFSFHSFVHTVFFSPLPSRSSPQPFPLTLTSPSKTNWRRRLLTFTTPYTLLPVWVVLDNWLICLFSTCSKEKSTICYFSTVGEHSTACQCIFTFPHLLVIRSVIPMSHKICWTRIIIKKYPHFWYLAVDGGQMLTQAELMKRFKVLFWAVSATLRHSRLFAKMDIYFQNCHCLHQIVFKKITI